MSAASKAAWRHAHPAAAAELNKQYRLRIRREAIEAYGGKCMRCPDRNPDHLEFDHANGGGNEHRDAIFGYGHSSPGGWNFLLWLKKQGYPQDLGIQLLCEDCHDKKDGRVPQRRRVGAGAA